MVDKQMYRECPSAAISRRRFLKLSATTLISSTVFHSIPAGAATGDNEQRRLRFHNIHTDEKYSCVYWRNGEYVQSNLRKLDFLLRDHRQNEVMMIDPRLFDVLHAVQSACNSTGTFHVISGYRSPTTNQQLRERSNNVAKRSYHMLGRAIDIRLSDTSLQDIRDAGAKLSLGGVGFYPGAGFVHLDTGPARQWTS